MPSPPRAVLERDVVPLSSSAMASRAAPRAGRARALAPARRGWTSAAIAILALTLAACTVRAPSPLPPPARVASSPAARPPPSPGDRVSAPSPLP